MSLPLPAHDAEPDSAPTSRDRPPPWWWTLPWALTLGFAVIYLLVALVQQERWGARAAWERDRQADMLRRAGDVGDLSADRATFLRVAETTHLRAYGRAVYASHCAGCHGSAGEGALVAPNLTDDAYLHVRRIEDIHDVIATGRRNGAMPAWRGRLTPDELILVTGYVASLQGTNAPGGKAAEGENVDDL